MSVKVTIDEVFAAENSVQMFLQKTEDKDFKDKIPFELTYWATKLNNKIKSQLTETRQILNKLNDDYGIKQKDAQKQLVDILGSQEKVDEFQAKRKEIMDDEVKIEIFPKKISQFEKTGIGGYTLMGLIPFLEDDFETKEKPKKEKGEKKDEK